MQFNAQQIATILNGTIEGNPDTIVNQLSKIEEGKPGSISFLSNPAYLQYIYDSKASIVIIDKKFKLDREVQSCLIWVDSAEQAFAQLLQLYNQIKLDKKGISNQAFISPNSTIGADAYIGEFAVIADGAKIGKNVKIYPQVFIGDNVVIGDNTTLFAGVKIYSDCEIGADCIIHSGTVIGSDGFRFAPESAGSKKIPQIGNVIIEDDVEMGANCAVDRATLGSTIIRKGVKFDNFIHIAHNVEVGENCYFAAHTVVAGSTKIGKNCMTSGQVGIVGHLKIADNTIVTAQSGISKSIMKPGEVMMGSPAFDANKYRKAFVHFRNLEALAQKINQLEQKIKSMEA
jgi:UDP-3-O-[3-hydroxymyristoyl] glucosamine N-acyltransferase